MGRLLEFLFFLDVALTVLALISCLSAEEGQVRTLPRIVWVIAILLFPVLGALAYFASGRPLRADAGGAAASRWRPGAGVAESSRPPRPLAPDDDPEFLRAMGRQARVADEDRLRRWEENLRQREDELRKKDTLGDEPSPGDG